MIRVLVVSPSVVVRAGLDVLVTDNATMQVVGQSSGGAALAADIVATHPDVILLDLDWQGYDPLPALPVVDGNEAEPALVILVDRPQGAWIADVLRSGVRGILPRESTPTAIGSAIQAAAQGLVTLDATTMANMLPLVSSPTPVRALPEAPHQSLTAREVEVLEMLAEGIGNKTIARRLGISEHTVKFHISSIFTKLGVTSRTEAVTLGARQGLIML
jgi:two-component system, NarL family, response regulator YdfI